jgi:hypothetical protein
MAPATREATRRAMEAAVDERLAALRARLLPEVALASQAADGSQARWRGRSAPTVGRRWCPAGHASGRWRPLMGTRGACGAAM